MTGDLRTTPEDITIAPLNESLLCHVFNRKVACTACATSVAEEEPAAQIALD